MNRCVVAATAALIGLLPAAGVRAQTVAGVELRETMQLDGQKLRLASCGARDTLWIDHYVAGLYIPPQTRAEPAVRDPKTRKVLVVRILNTEHFPEQLPEKWREPLKASLSAEKFSQVSSAYQKLRQGDTMLYTYSPDTGLVMTVNGDKVVEAGHGVIDALLRAWQRGEDSGTLGKLLKGHDC